MGGAWKDEYDGAEGGGGREKEPELEVGMEGRFRDIEPKEFCIPPKVEGAGLELVMLPNAELVLLKEDVLVVGVKMGAVEFQVFVAAVPQFTEEF